MVCVHTCTCGFLLIRMMHMAGADITDYFNYGFTEELWKVFCEKQRRMKVEVSQLNRSVSFAQYMPPPNARNPNPLTYIIS